MDDSAFNSDHIPPSTSSSMLDTKPQRSVDLGQSPDPSLSLSTTLGSAKPKPGFLFVSCNELNGRPAQRERQLLNRHVMLHYSSANSDGKSQQPQLDTIITFDQDPAPPPVPSSRISQTSHASLSATKPEEVTHGPQKKNPTARTPARGQTQQRQISQTEVQSISRDHIRTKKKAQRTTTFDPTSALQKYPTPTSPDPSPALSYDRSLEEMCKWFLYCRNDVSLTCFTVARTHWIDAAWDIMRRSDLFYDCILLYTWRKRADLDGRVDEYFAQKGKLLSQIARRVSSAPRNRRGHVPMRDVVVDDDHDDGDDLLTFVAIGILAYCSLLDAQIEATGTHLRALRAMGAIDRFERARQEWMYVIWVDLRYALLLGIPPVLEYFLPSVYRVEVLPYATPELAAAAYERTTESAERASRSSPSSSSSDDALLTQAEAFDLFFKMWQLYDAWPSLQHTSEPPYGRLYDLEYRLRILDARVLQPTTTMTKSRVTMGAAASSPPSMQPQPHTAICVQLLLSAIQLHVWFLSRFWAPVSGTTRLCALNRSCRLLLSIHSHYDDDESRNGVAGDDCKLIAMWQSTGADLTSLFWVLSTITACALDERVDPALIPSGALQCVLSELCIRRRYDFLFAMRQWPWVDNWHPAKMDALWAHMEHHACDLSPDDEAMASLSLAARRPSPPSGHFYLGAVEFYDT